MSRHTKGPWTVDERYEDAVSVIGADGFEVADIATTATSPAWFEKHPDTHWGNDETSHVERSMEEATANARLIAAAPDLFMVCQLAVTNEVKVDGLRGSGMVDDAEIKAIRAIAKAARDAIAKTQEPTHAK